MSQFDHHSQQERNEQGFQVRTAAVPVELPMLDGDGSMLLDSINAYLRVEEDGLDTLTEFPEEPYERERTQKQSEGSKMQENKVLSPIPAADESAFEPIFLPFEVIPQQQETLAQEKTFYPVNEAEGRGNYIELSYSQYNTNGAQVENKESRLLSQDQPQHSTEEKTLVITSFAESQPVGLEEKSVRFNDEICSFQPQTEENQQKEDKNECQSVDTKNLRVIVVEEQGVANEAISNQSINSTIFLNLLPQDYFSEGQCSIEPLPEQNRVQQQQKQQEKEQPIIEYMDIEFPAPYVEVPQNNCIDVNDQSRMEIPMDIESIGFKNPPQQEMPNIQIDLIQQNVPAQEHQWAEAREILDNLSTKSIIDQLNDVYPDKPQEFTFGKTEIQEVAEECNNSFDKEIMQIEIINNMDNIDALPNQNPPAAEIPEENVNNLSLEVQHDSNFVEAMRDLEEAPASSIKEQSELKANPEVALPSKANEEARNQQEVVVQEVVFLEHVQEEIEEKVVKPVVYVEIIDEKEKDFAEKVQERNEKVMRMNQVCNMSISSNEMMDRSTSLFGRNSNMPRIIFQNEAFPLASSAPAPIQQIQQQPSNPQQSSNLSFPTINVTFRDNQMNVNITGPAFSYENNNLPQRPETILQQPEVSNCISCHKAEKMVELEELIEPRPSLLPEISIRREGSPMKIVTSEKEIMTEPVSTQIEEFDDSMEQYQLVITSSETYLLNFAYFSEAQHKNFEKQVNKYVLLRFTPQPKTQLGAKLFNNGLFLIALVKLITRLSPTPFIVCYMYEYLESAFGSSITKNGYVFKSELEKAKNSYEAALEKKFNDLIVGKATVVPAQKEAPVIRRNIAESDFFSIRCEKKDQSSQVTPKKIAPTPEILPVPELPQKTLYFSAEKKIEPFKQAKEEARAVPPVKQSVSPIKIVSFAKEEKNEKVDTQKDETYKQDRLKKSIEEIKAAYGSGFKRTSEESQKKDTEVDAPNKFSELFQKYKKIKESAAAENSAVRHLSPVLKEKDQAKKPTKKQVVFNDEVIISKDSTELNESEQDLAKRRKKKKTNKSKRDSSAQPPEEFLATRRQNHSKK